MNQKRTFGFLKWFIGAAAFVLCIRYFEDILDFFRILKNIIFPLLLGCGLAYILNIVMSKLEKRYFPKRKDRWVSLTRRPVCLTASVAIVLGIALLVIKVVFPELIGAITLLGEGVPVYFEKVRLWALENTDQIPALEEWLSGLKIDWAQIVKNVVAYLTSGLGGILNSTVAFVGIVGKSVFHFVVGGIFAIYLLFNKERLLSQAKRVMAAFLRQPRIDQIVHVVKVAHRTFTSFITGQCTEAMILGLLCTGGMLLFRFPYAAMVGTLVGASALIPVVGAYIGAVVGAFMILTVSPAKAVAFVIFLVILQQLEGNIIYPRVVGASIGLPGMWVLVAVTVGGGLGGIAGMLLGVPLAATLYKLFAEYVRHREIRLEEEKEA